MAQSMGIGGMPNMGQQQGVMPQQLAQPILQQPPQAAQQPLTDAAVRGLVGSDKPIL